MILLKFYQHAAQILFKECISSGNTEVILREIYCKTYFPIGCVTFSDADMGGLKLTDTTLSIWRLQSSVSVQKITVVWKV